MQALHTLFTPGGGTITFGQYYFRNVFFDTVRVAILRDQPNPIKWTCGEFSCWSAVALHVVNSGVRILGCPEFQTNEHPLIDELSKLVRTHHITTGAGSEFPICVLGDVHHFEGTPREVHSNKPDGGKYRDLGQIYSITIRTSTINVEKTVKGIISVSACWNDPHGNKPTRET